METVERLAFRCMEKCKVESSTDSDSDMSPEAGVSSTSESGTGRSRVGPWHSARKSTWPSLDPYDGSSENSSDSSDCSLGSQQVLSGAGQLDVPIDTAAVMELGHFEKDLQADVHMRSFSDSEVPPVSVLQLEGPLEKLHDSGIHSELSFSTIIGSTESPSGTMKVESCRPFSRVSSMQDPLQKRKLLCHADTGECLHKKKQRVIHLEVSVTCCRSSSLAFLRVYLLDSFFFHFPGHRVIPAIH
ncbi:uncharacterized protein LOC120518368 isoform X2 [Polypterus senegalus]|nr:uncharacterized protein LOC120518368 isoform X2 [Polypterus senegalus]XP_039597077.1 uncharacterized protein LOC120518368 isoform X2 [Polypterus senegalus]